MALGDDYSDLPTLKLKVNVDQSDTQDDTLLQQALTAASRAVERFCHRQFNTSETAVARTYMPNSEDMVVVDDFHTLDGLVVEVDEAKDGTYSTELAPSAYVSKPLGGISEGVMGWPWWRLHALGSQRFPVDGERPTIRVTAVWGWAAIPHPILEATLMLAEEMYKLKDAPFGVAGFGEYGDIRVRDNPKIKSTLLPYRRGGIRMA